MQGTAVSGQSQRIRSSLHFFGKMLIPSFPSSLSSSGASSLAASFARSSGDDMTAAIILSFSSSVNGVSVSFT